LLCALKNGFKFASLPSLNFSIFCWISIATIVYQDGIVFAT
jgi:hypothetical protein